MIRGRARRRWSRFVAHAVFIGAPLVGGACGPGEVIVMTEVELEDPESGGLVARPLASLEVAFLPFDREAVLDSLSVAFGKPEPPIPSAFVLAHARARAAQEEWQEATARWNAVRDTLQTIKATIEAFDRDEPRYAELFAEFESFDFELAEAGLSMDEAFRGFADLRRAAMQQADSIRMLRDAWADEAYAEADLVFQERQRAAGLVAVTDTTDAAGMAGGGSSERALRMRPGRYWLNARYELLDTELHWNIPVTVERGGPVRIRLTRQNAEERIKL